jgi:hypothetical protein
MPPAVRFVLRHPASVVLVLVAALAAASVFLFARPQYHPRYENEMIDFATRHYYSPAVVRQAFAAHGIRLRYSGRARMVTWLSNTPSFEAHDLSVLVAPRAGEGSWGPKLEPYDERFGNVLVTYGGSDQHLLRQIKGAVGALR